jgi:hypothetical protein
MIDYGFIINKLWRLRERFLLYYIFRRIEVIRNTEKIHNFLFLPNIEVTKTRNGLQCGCVFGKRGESGKKYKLLERLHEEKRLRGRREHTGISKSEMCPLYLRHVAG